jgi:hypothetical protein
MVGNRTEGCAKLDQSLNGFKVSLRDGVMESRVLILVEGVYLRPCGNQQLNRSNVATNRRDFEGAVAETSRRINSRARPAHEFREIRHLVQDFVRVLPLPRVHSI